MFVMLDSLVWCPRGAFDAQTLGAGGRDGFGDMLTGGIAPGQPCVSDFPPARPWQLAFRARWGVSGDSTGLAEK